MESAFVGRTSEIARLEGLGAGTLVTLWGPGGVGKTKLARELVQRERHRGRLVAGADLAGARTPREVLAAIGSALGMVRESGDATGSDEVEALGRAACAQRALLVADNLEQLDDDARSVVVRLARVVVASGSAGGASVHATSRELLGAGHGVETELALAQRPLADGTRQRCQAPHLRRRAR